MVSAPSLDAPLFGCLLCRLAPIAGISYRTGCNVYNELGKLVGIARTFGFRSHIPSMRPDPL